jgi:hypothetical protein
VVPVNGSFSIGADAYLFLRDSHYSLTDSATREVRREDVRQRNPQLRVYLAVNKTR